jgi:hypothetical protein
LDALDPDHGALRPVRSEQDLADMNSLGMFTRRSTFADVPYLALPGINSRVSYTTSQHSVQSDLQETFLAQGDVRLMPSFTPALLKATFTALLSAFQFGCELERLARLRRAGRGPACAAGAAKGTRSVGTRRWIRAEVA